MGSLSPSQRNISWGTGQVRKATTPPSTTSLSFYFCAGFTFQDSLIFVLHH
jgi:hypothetical protein